MVMLLCRKNKLRVRILFIDKWLYMFYVHDRHKLFCSPNFFYRFMVTCLRGLYFAVFDRRNTRKLDEPLFCFNTACRFFFVYCKTYSIHKFGIHHKMHSEFKSIKFNRLLHVLKIVLNNLNSCNSHFCEYIKQIKLEQLHQMFYIPELWINWILR